ncbi:MAG: hypothetical protein HY721_27625 [Planctomycetes bacterium]|nr:hypothetical protein [Planctomycetota bacterium]
MLEKDHSERVSWSAMGRILQGTAWCDGCGLETRIERRRPRHLLHLLLSIATGGTWLPIWGVLALRMLVS